MPTSRPQHSASAAPGHGLGKQPPRDPPSSPPACLKAVEAGEFLALQIAARSYLLEPVLPERGLVMLHAYRGVGKTHVALGIAYAVASGGTFLRWSAPAPQGVVYVDGEMPARTMQERLAALVESSAHEARPGMLRFVLADQHDDGLPDLGSAEFQDSLEALVVELGAKAVVLDNLSSLLRSGRENEADSWQPVQDFLLRLRRKGVSVLLVHHDGKGGQQRGTSRREDVLDTVIGLRRPKDYVPADGARFEIHLDKARGVFGELAEPMEAKLEVRDGAAVWTTRKLAEADLARVIALTDEGMSVREIAELLTMPKSNVSRLQKKARDAGSLSQPARPTKRHFDGTADRD